MRENASLPANPVLAHDSWGNLGHRSPGLTKREEFAKAALQGILANTHYDPPRRMKLSGMATDAVAAADALLAALEKSP